MLDWSVFYGLLIRLFPYAPRKGARAEVGFHPRGVVRSARG
jgi:hypothetical protein